MPSVARDLPPKSFSITHRRTKKARRDHLIRGSQIIARDSWTAKHGGQAQASQSRGATSSACCGK